MDEETKLFEVKRWTAPCVKSRSNSEMIQMLVNLESEPLVFIADIVRMQEKISAHLRECLGYFDDYPSRVSS